jgi:cytochrome c biogenesis protein CcdA
VLVAAGRDDGPAAAVARALRCTAALTLGYVAVFGTFGLVLAPVAGAVQPHLPWLTVLLGLGLAGTGVWLLLGRSLPVPGRGLRAPRLTGSVPSTVLFGMAYAAASLGCAAGPFLAIVVTGLRTGSVLPFLGYAAGMGLVIGVTAVAVALARASVLGGMRRAAAAVPRLSGLMLILTGPYVAWYGWYELRLAGNRRLAGADPVVNAAGELQRAISVLVGRAGAGGLLALLLVLGLITAAVARRRVSAGRAPAPRRPARSRTAASRRPARTTPSAASPDARRTGSPHRWRPARPPGPGAV